MSEVLPALWPSGLKIEVIGLTGEFSSGKTLFAVTIDPTHSIVYDTEKSSGTFESLGYKRIDVGGEMLTAKPAGYKPIDVFLWWRNHVRNLKPGEYRVIVLDTVTEIENGLVEYVRQNPNEFGYTSNQFARAEGLMWGAAKSYWKMLLDDLASRCETFAFTSHLRSVWQDNKPVKGVRQPKGKETLMELASLYLHLERKPDNKGRVPKEPAAIVLKSRLAVAKLNGETGEVDVVPCLPPRIEKCTPAMIRHYILNPPDYAKLKPSELAPEQTLSDDERLAMEKSKAEAERDAAALKLEHANLMRQAAERQAAAKAVIATPDASSVPSSPPPEPRPQATPEQIARALDGNNSATAPQPKQPTDGLAAAEPVLATEGQLRQLKTLKDELKIPPEQWTAILAKRGVSTARNLKQTEADELINKLAHRLNVKDLEADFQRMQDEAIEGK